MAIGGLLFGLFILGYTAFALAIIWHLEVYSFTRNARYMMVIFAGIAIILMLFALADYFAIPWDNMQNFYPTFTPYHA